MGNRRAERVLYHCHTRWREVIGYTDVVQVLVLIISLVTTYLALSLLADKFGFDGNIWKALGILRSEAPDHSTWY